MEYSKLFSRIRELLETNNVVNVAIDGMSGSGKSTLAEKIRQAFDCNVFHMDDYFLTPELRTRSRLNEVGGNVDYVRFKREVIDMLNSGTEFFYRPYNCKTCSISAPVKVPPKKLNVIEGVYSMHPSLRGAYDLKVFMFVDSVTQQKRILHRSGEELLERFVNEWIPMENRYFDEYNIRILCDIIYSN